MKKRIEIKELFEHEDMIVKAFDSHPDHEGLSGLVKGWVKNRRDSKGATFIVLTDGSTARELQVVAPADFDLDLTEVTIGSSIAVEGRLIKSQGRGQLVEFKAYSIEVIGKSDASKYPMQPKKHSMEYFRDYKHLRMRTKIFSSVFRVRHALTMATHKFFDEQGFYIMHTPIITASDAEGAGETFTVTTLKDQMKGFSEDFFGVKSSLTVSGQLEAETGAMAMGKVYTFGPTFRAEDSRTTRHLAEFWMIEPEVAFADLDEVADLAKSYLQYMAKYVKEHCKDDIDILEDFLQEEEKQFKKEDKSISLYDRIDLLTSDDYARVTYTEAIDILLKSKPHKKGKFEFPVSWGIDLQSEHEKYLVEKHFKKPVIVTDYPKDIKAFYMKLGEDGKTVRAMDVLIPGIGEIIGGSQREDDYDTLVKRMDEMGVPKEELDWYLDLRRFGTAPHAGFGLGFERMVMFLTGMKSIRDVIPYPRTPKSL
jgi:asparaginyl-tRNA synthetase